MYRIIVRVFKLSSVVLFILTLALPSYAQDAPASSDCPDAAAVLPVIAEFLTELADEPMTALDVIYDAILEVRVKCAGLVFTSEEYGLDTVIGPIDIPAGVYRVILAANSPDLTFDMEIIGLDGSDCGLRNPSFFSSGRDGDQKVLQAEQCTALLETSTLDWAFDDVPKTWTLTFEKVR